MSSVPAFTFPGLRSRVLFGSGTLAEVGPEMERLGRARALVLSTPQRARDAQALSQQLGNLSAGILAEAVMHTPVEVTERAVKALENSGADCVVALGGGSTVGLGKALAARTGIDQVVVPTTYAGSEMTDILGETANGAKKTRRDPSILPEVVIYDVDLTLSLPPSLSVTSGLNALAHAAEALYAPDRNPIVALMSAEAVRALAEALPAVKADPADRDARTLALYGAWLCSAALGNATMSLHHKICHTLGGSFNTPHAETHAVMLPHTISFNAPAVGTKLAPLEQAFGATPGVGLFDFAARLGSPARLKDLGLSEADLDRAAAIAVANPYANPMTFGRDDIRALLQDAWEGRRPAC